MRTKNKGKIVTKSMASKWEPYVQYRKLDKVVEEYKEIFSSPMGVPLHCQVKHSIDLSPSAPLPSGPIYHHSLLENKEIKKSIQNLLHLGHIQPSSSPNGIPIVLMQNKCWVINCELSYLALNYQSKVGVLVNYTCTIYVRLSTFN